LPGAAIRALNQGETAMKQHRIARVAEAIREVAAETILFELQDPRIKNVTVTRAEVSGDLQKAKIYVSVMGTQKEQDLCMHGLRHSAGYVQSKVASRLKTRYTPTITFIRDDGVKKSIEMSRLINEALTQSRPETQPDSADGTADEASEEG
jgi:ribosome-binding factor A